MAVDKIRDNRVRRNILQKCGELFSVLRRYVDGNIIKGDLGIMPMRVEAKFWVVGNFWRIVKQRRALIGQKA